MDWRRFSKKLLLADGAISEAETAALRRAMLADGMIDQDEVGFLMELKREATSVHPSFTEFLQTVIRRGILRDGQIGASEVAWLRKMVFEDRVADPDEVEFLRTLAREAKQVSREYVALLEECDAAGLGKKS